MHFNRICQTWPRGNNPLQTKVVYAQWLTSLKSFISILRSTISILVEQLTCVHVLTRRRMGLLQIDQLQQQDARPERKLPTLQSILNAFRHPRCIAS